MARLDTAVLSHWYHFIEDFNTSSLDFYTAVEEAVTRRGLPEDVSMERVTYKEGGVFSAKREYLRVKRGRLLFDICAAPYGKGFFFSWWLAKKTGGAFLALVLLFFLVFVYGYLFLMAVLISIAQSMSGLTQPGGGGCSVLFWFIVLTPVVVYAMGKAVQKEVFCPEEKVIEIPVVGSLYLFLFGGATYYRLDTAIMFQESVRRAVNEVLAGIMSEQGRAALAPDELKPEMFFSKR